MIYAVFANMIIGTAIAIWLLKPPLLQRFLTTKQLGFQSPVKRVIVAIVIAGLIGFALFIFQKPASLNPIVILNVFLADSACIYCRGDDMLGRCGNYL